MDGFYIAPNHTLLDRVTEPEQYVGRIPGMKESLDAAKDLREQNGTGLGGLWMHVASIRGPIFQIGELLKDGSPLLSSKPAFYAWLDKHPQYLAYDRRAARAKTLKTFHGWKGAELGD